jgi:hypothetical protein
LKFCTEYQKLRHLLPPPPSCSLLPYKLPTGNLHLLPALHRDLYLTFKKSPDSHHPLLAPVIEDILVGVFARDCAYRKEVEVIEFEREEAAEWQEGRSALPFVTQWQA